MSKSGDRSVKLEEPEPQKPERCPVFSINLNDLVPKTPRVEFSGRRSRESRSKSTSNRRSIPREVKQKAKEEGLFSCTDSNQLSTSE